MKYFRIIIPNYNNSKWLEKCISSIETQTFKDYQIIIIDDMSTDNSVDIIKGLQSKYDNIILIQAEKKAYNGGSRNIGIRYPLESLYTLFLDSDDWYKDDSRLKLIYDTIEANNKPDCISLSYEAIINRVHHRVSLKRDTPEKLVEDLNVACWTKCIKSELIQEFPENTLMEDVVQHIKQVDVIKNVVSIVDPIVCWNRNNLNSCSRKENQDLQNGKWKSSMYRYAGDLLDLELNTDYCKRHRDWRFQVVNTNIKNGEYIQ